jgi:hypothetical protein
MINHQQYKRLMSEYEKTGQMTTSALKADLHPQTARKYIRAGQSPAQLQVPHTWRTRPDPLAKIWEPVAAMLRDAPELEAQTLFEYFLARPDSGLAAPHLRTFQRRVRQWRATHGPQREVFFAQERKPGELMQLDWTYARELQVTIQGEGLDHLFCHCVLPYSNWAWATRCLSESFLSLVSGLQAALAQLGRCPPNLGTDNSSAATHELEAMPGRPRGYNSEYLELCTHYDVTPVTIHVGCPHEQGDVESANGHLKRRLRQHLLLRGSREFAAVEDYDRFVQGVLRAANAPRQPRLAEELAAMRPLPAGRLAEYREYAPVVSSQSLIRVRGHTVRLSQPDGDVSELADDFEMQPEAQAKLEMRLTVPSALGRHATATFILEYANTGNAAMPAPLLVLKGSERPFLTLHNNIVTEGFWTSAQPAGFSDSVQFLGSGSSPGILQPGESRRVPIYYAGLQTPWTWNPTVQFCTGVLPASRDLHFEPNYNAACDSLLGPPMAPAGGSLKSAKSADAQAEHGSASPFDLSVDWPTLKQQMRPPSISPEAWDILWANFISQVGTTWYDYTRMLDANLAYLGRLVRVNDATDISRLLTFEFLKADGLSPLRSLAGGVDAAVEAPGLPLAFSRTFPATISGRFELGSLGRGWSHNWQYALEKETDGTVVVIGPGGSRRVFKPDSRFWASMAPAGAARVSDQLNYYTSPRQYFPQAGDHGQLTAYYGGVFTLREPSGLLRAFHADGKLDYLEDPNGNRITCGYSGSLLISLSHSSGQSLAIGYTGNFIQTITDSVGRQTVFGYTGEHLTSVQ